MVRYRIRVLTKRPSLQPPQGHCPELPVCVPRRPSFLSWAPNNHWSLNCLNGIAFSRESELESYVCVTVTQSCPTLRHHGCVFVFLPPNENNDFLFRECNLTVWGYSFGPTLGRPMMSPGSSQQEFTKHQAHSPHYATNTTEESKAYPCFPDHKSEEKTHMHSFNKNYWVHFTPWSK